MEQPTLKFAVQRADGTVSDEFDGTVEEMTTGSIRLAVAASTLELLELDPTATFFEQNRLLLSIDLPDSKIPLRTLAEVSFCELSHGAESETYSLVAEFREIPEESRRRLLRYLQPGRGRRKERRKRSRRGSHLFLRELGRTLRILSGMSEGRGEDFGTQYAKLVSLKGGLGRRRSDAKLGDEICIQIERLASDLARSAGTKMGLRMVQIRKLTGRGETKAAGDEVLVGWEESPPQVGRSYLLYLEKGGIFRSAQVTQVHRGHFRTCNSLYKVEKG